MTKPREKTREELTAEIEESKKKIRQFENREKIIKQKLSVEERKARTHRLCKRGGFMESLVPELIAMPDEDAKAFLRLAFFEKTSRGRERGVIPLEQRAHLYTLAGVCARRRKVRLPSFPPYGENCVRSLAPPFPTKQVLRGPHVGLISAQGTFPALRYGGFAATRGCTPCAAYAAIPAHPQKQYTRLWRLYHFCGFSFYPGGDTHSHLSL